jgi:hypothetical protein
MQGWRTDAEEITENDELEFISYREHMKVEGGFTFSFTTVTYNDVSDCITLINGDNNTAVTCWINPHPDAQYPQAITDGVRLGKALDRCYKGSTVEETIERASEAGGSLTVSKAEIEGKDYWAWRWEVKSA